MITDPAVEGYLRSLLPPRDRVLLKMEERARRERIPIVGPLVGTVLSQLAFLLRARRVFELGSAIGYSTVWLARAVGPSGRVFYTDADPGKARDAARYLARAGLLSRVTLLVGDALQSFRRTPGDFDLVFNDVDKQDYPRVWKAASARIRPGGLFLSDNTLWSGRVAQTKQDAWTRAIHRMNLAVAKDRRFVSSLLPLRDGLTVAWKREGRA